MTPQFIKNKILFRDIVRRNAPLSDAGSHKRKKKHLCFGFFFFCVYLSLHVSFSHDYKKTHFSTRNLAIPYTLCSQIQPNAKPPFSAISRFKRFPKLNVTDKPDEIHFHADPLKKTKNIPDVFLYVSPTSNGRIPIDECKRPRR